MIRHDALLRKWVYGSNGTSEIVARVGIECTILVDSRVIKEWLPRSGKIMNNFMGFPSGLEAILTAEKGTPNPESIENMSKMGISDA
jgi:hypothetical protein